MNYVFSDRILNTQKSFIREILKVAQSPEIISFAGGLPNPGFFPADMIAEASFAALKENGPEILQYTTTEGYLPLRELIAKRYEKRGLKVSPEEILITNGSQQGLDLIGKVFLNKGDKIVMERPGYLGAIQAFGLFEPEFIPVDLKCSGIDVDMLEDTLKQDNIKLIYSVTNFQNPSGTTYSLETRKQVAKLIEGSDTIFIEDDAYGELRFIGDDIPPVKSLCSENTILLGSFSKIVSPGLRLGWICAGKEIMDRLVTAKQASDLHSNHLSQWIVQRFLSENDVDLHIKRIREAYGRQRDVMVQCLKTCFSQDVGYTKPEGGMFLWLTLPKGMSSMELFNVALEKRVAFVPGIPFYVDGGGVNTLRLNYTNSDEDKITEGMKKLADSIKLLS